MSAEEALTLRPAELADAELLRRWRNEASTRAQSFDTDHVAPDDHLRWLRQRLADVVATRIWIGEVDGEPVGQVRVVRIGEDLGEISVSVDTAARGRGLGASIIAAGTARAAVELALTSVDATVKGSNGASLAAFRSAGYLDSRGAEYDGEPVVVLRWTVQ